MTDNKLEQSARQVLEWYDGNVDGASLAFTALREALGNSLKPKCFADYQPNHAIDRACASCPVAVECQTGEQAEQEPYYFGLTHDHTWLSIDKKQYDKLKPEGRMACYIAPVRTKDLTDDEIWKVWDKVADDLGFARAVIAADRSKNGIV